MTESIENILTEELETLKSDITTRHETAGQKASGATISSLETLTNVNTGQLLGATYLGVLERGRRPGKTPKGFVEILKAWIKAKGLSFSDDDDLTRFANAIKWKMIKSGSELYQAGGRQDIYTPAIADFENRLASRIAVYFEQEIKNKIEDK